MKFALIIIMLVLSAYCFYKGRKIHHKKDASYEEISKNCFESRIRWKVSGAILLVLAVFAFLCIIA
jgi:putative copper export protein